MSWEKVSPRSRISFTKSGIRGAKEKGHFYDLFMKKAQGRDRLKKY
jgi:hypothetical protein